MGESRMSVPLLTVTFASSGLLILEIFPLFTSWCQLKFIILLRTSQRQYPIGC